ncbi:MAG: ATP synthase F1 subunit delta [Bacteroidia bacterium]|nr:ATP synthase F1 subunit delta [Bacteroidia bacterium]
MNQSKIAVRYAKALFLLAKEKNLLEPVRNDINLIYRVIKESEEIHAYFSNPVVKPLAKKQVLHRLFDGRINEMSLNFLSLVTTNKREQHLSDICRNFNDIYRADKGIKTVVFSTAVPMPEAIYLGITDITSGLFKSQVELTRNTDVSLIGGFILQVEDLLYNSSVRAKLDHIRKEIVNTSFDKKM